MKKIIKPETETKKALVLRRESVRTLDDDALHQTRGGGAMSGSKVALMMNQN